MKNVLTILVSLGFVVCGQTAFGQAQTQTKPATKTDWSKPVWQTEKAATQAEVEKEIKSAAFAKSHPGKHRITVNPRDPREIYLNGQEFKLVKSQSSSYYKYDKNDQKVYVGKEAVANTYASGKDTIQVATYPPRKAREEYFDNLPLIEPAPGSQISTRLVEPNDSVLQAKTTPNGQKFSAHKAVFTEHDKGTGNSYILRAKIHTNDPSNRTDRNGGTYQSVKNTDIPKTFGPLLENRPHKIYGPETSYK